MWQKPHFGKLFDTLKTLVANPQWNSIANDNSHKTRSVLHWFTGLVECTRFRFRSAYCGHRVISRNFGLFIGLLSSSGSDLGTRKVCRLVVDHVRRLNLRGCFLFPSFMLSIWDFLNRCLL